MPNYYRADELVNIFGEDRAAGAAAASYGDAIDTASSRVDEFTTASINARKLRVAQYNFITPSSGSTATDVYELAILPQDAVVIGCTVSGTAIGSAANSTLTFSFGSSQIGTAVDNMNSGAASKSTGMAATATTTDFPLVKLTLSTADLADSKAVKGTIVYYTPSDA